MSFSSNLKSICISLLLLSIVSRSLQDLIVLRRYDDGRQKFTCISDDYDAALIWNENDGTFYSKSSKLESTRVIGWENIEGWDEVTSRNKPMGPVFDYRWEAFQEIKGKEFEGSIEPQITGTVIFSVRGRNDVNVDLCERDDPTTSSCFEIIIGEDQGSKSSISLHRESSSASARVSHESSEPIINDREWRTFTIKWMSDTRTIQVFKDIDDTPFLQGFMEKWHPVSKIRVQSRPNASILRFHFYEYWFTKNKSSTISTSVLNNFVTTNCVQLFVGLCAKCSLIVNQINEKKETEVIETVKGDSKSLTNDVLTWKSIKLQNKFPELINSGSIKLKITLSLDGDEEEGRWAIDKFRTCESNVTTRESKNPFPDSHKVNCQKLSYNDISTVESSSGLDIHDDDKDKIREYLIEWIKRSANPMRDEKKWGFCNTDGCTCNRGYSGSDCTKECQGNSYGYDCKEMQTSCESQMFNKENGHCISKCEGNYAVNRFLPLCKFGPERPKVEILTDDSVKLTQKIELAQQQQITSIKFEIQGHNIPFEIGAKIAPTIYGVNVTNLKKNQKYHVSTTLKIKNNHDVISKKQNEFVITLFAKCYKIIEAENSLIIKLREDLKNCKENIRREYDRLETEIGSKSAEWVLNEKFNFEFNNLLPDVEYAINVKSRGKPIFTTVARTLHKSVQGLESKFITDKKVSLKWQSVVLNNDDEVQTEYRVSIEVEKFFGCNDSINVTTEQNLSRQLKVVKGNKTTFDNLEPYRRYKITVNASRSVPAVLFFNTRENYIPTYSVVNDLRIEDDKFLTWNYDANDDKTIDCKKITTKIDYVRLVVTGIDLWAINEIHRQEYELKKINNRIELDELKLTPYTLYKIRVHLIRNREHPENINIFKEVNWKSFPAVPPKVKDFQIYDADVETNSISLTWGEPYPPHGELEYYQVSTKDNKDNKFKLLDQSYGNKSCEIWKNYLCIEDIKLPENFQRYEIKIFAKNKNVEGNGNETKIVFSLDDFKKAPAKLKNITETILSNNIVKLNWVKPMSLTKILKYRIVINYVDTDLKTNKSMKFPINFDYTIKNDDDNNEDENRLSKLVELESSTTYNITVTSISKNKTESQKFFKTFKIKDNFQFINDEKLEYEILNDTLIELTIPRIDNTTRNSEVRVNVYGDLNCMKNNDNSSISKKKITYKIENIDETKLTIGVNYPTKERLTCSLNPEKSYDIEISIKNLHNNKSTEVSKLTIYLKKYDLTLLWLLMIPLIIICSVLIINFYRKHIKSREKSSRNLIYPLTQLRATDYFTAIFRRKNSPSFSSSTTKIIGNSESEHIYAAPYDSDSRAVRTEHFSDYVEKSVDSGTIFSQYITLPRNLTKPCEYGKLPQNMAKNRDMNQIAYDDTRVILQKRSDDPYSDYINASYIKGYLNDRAYIATQGPMTNTINDFWRMIWEKKVYVICMLSDVTNVKKKDCEKYWPEVDSKETYGDIHVTNTGHQVFADYTVRNFRIVHQKFKRKITQLHYTQWPDKGLPSCPQSVVSYLKKISETPNGNGPIVVHCSTGDGRTGTIILCDICLTESDSKNVIDVLAVTSGMRKNRANMVGNTEQYILAHIVIIESLTSSPTQVLCTNDFLTEIEKMRKKLKSHIKRLTDKAWQERALYALVMPKCPTPGDFSMKILSDLNSVCPDVIYFERLSSIPMAREHDNYIGTVSVDGYKTRKQFLASQLPSPSTLSSYWRLISLNNVELVIVLQRSEPEDPSYCDIVPEKSPFCPIPNVIVNVKSRKRDQHYTTKKLLLTDRSGDDPRFQSITVLRCTGWGDGKNGKPPPVDDLVSFWRFTEKIPRKKGRILVLCCDGITGCGLYLSMNIILEKMTVDRECDVISAVRSVRRSRQEFVEKVEQFEYLYDAAISYFKCFATYDNLV